MYLEDKEMDLALEMYFMENELDIYDESMNQLITLDEETYNLLVEDYLLEAGKSKEEKEAEKLKKLEARINKARKVTANVLDTTIRENVKKYKSFEFVSHPATKKERVIYAAKNGIDMGAGSAATTFGLNLATSAGRAAGVGNVAKFSAAWGAKVAVVSAIVGLMIELFKQKMYKEIYTIKLYGIKEDGKKKLIYWVSSVKVEESDLNSSSRSKLKKKD